MTLVLKIMISCNNFNNACSFNIDDNNTFGGYFEYMRY